MANSDVLGDLLIAVSSGKRDAFQILYARTSPRFYGVALRLLRHKDRATAALKAAYLSIWNEAAALRPLLDAAARAGDAPAGRPEGEALRDLIGDPLCWMVAHVRRVALDLAREQASDDGSVFEPFAAEEEADDPLAGEPRSRELLELLGCLGQLSEERRRMVLLAYYDGWTRDALSIYFDAPLHGINSWLRRSVGEIDAVLQ
ncbi:sigma factor-like helix-turn-helix DNA-binding protein [Roseixanthobacter liquoris]|uniref:sigma factor-like helix-turn-helix DNA-binding protein n=1 Tax=Roseixanthobacter liquoris TaxID=3119921 RepID=UPI00372657CB